MKTDGCRRSFTPECGAGASWPPPHLDQLRRQARELLRAATDGEPAARNRIRAFSGRVSLSAAQLAVAREYGFASWPALHAEVERRLAELPLNIAAVLPRVGDIVVRGDSIVLEPETWKLHLRAEPSWWIYSAGGQQKWAATLVHAEDDLGGMYLSHFGGSSGPGFRPGLNPRARILALIFRPFRHPTEQVTIELRLP